MIDRLEKSGGSVGYGRSWPWLILTGSPPLQVGGENGCDYDSGHGYGIPFSGARSTPLPAQVGPFRCLNREGSQRFDWDPPPVAVGSRGRDGPFEKRAARL